jgi:hypothetical protein
MCTLGCPGTRPDKRLAPALEQAIRLRVSGNTAGGFHRQPDDLAAFLARQTMRAPGRALDQLAEPRPLLRLEAAMSLVKLDRNSLRDLQRQSPSDTG